MSWSFEDIVQVILAISWAVILIISNSNYIINIQQLVSEQLAPAPKDVF